MFDVESCVGNTTSNSTIMSARWAHATDIAEGPFTRRGLAALLSFKWQHQIHLLDARGTDAAQGFELEALCKGASRSESYCPWTCLWFGG